MNRLRQKYENEIKNSMVEKFGYKSVMEIPNIDKIVHICMYLGMSGMLWLEFLRAHQKPLEAARFQAVFCIIQQQGRNLHFCIKFYGFRLANLARVEYNRANDIL